MTSAVDVFHGDFSALASWNHDRRDMWSIPVDVMETQKKYIFFFDVPGLSKSDIQVSIEGESTMVVRSSGKRKREDQKEQELCKYVRMERKVPSQKMERKFRLPANVNVSAISAKCESGVQTVLIEKFPPHQSPKLSRFRSVNAHTLLPRLLDEE